MPIRSWEKKMILEALTVGFIATNCYIVASDFSKRGMVIDPGAEAKAIIKEIERLKLKISLIVITHSHFDHTGAVKALVDATGAKFAVGGGTKKAK